jgi:hypothetical protein
VTSAGGIVRVGHAGGDGQPDPMCEFGFGNGTIFAPVGTGGTPVQGTVETLAGRSSGGSGANSGLTAQGGGSGEVVLSW